ncbi:MAG TPA: ribosome assembly RNA-binding protein YhbY [Chitinispirillaceae bacterium]|nr:ribosome assembly RNA-binding protein YhbY [Chitinispirillaceae bacterium]
MPLSSAQKKYLKGLGHSLTPVIHIGKEGITDRLIASISKALSDHELIKVTLLENSELERDEAAEAVSRSTDSETVQILGKKILFYKSNPQKKKIILPE